MSQVDQCRKAEEDQALSGEARLTAIAALSHDVRTPMSGILGMAELLLAGNDLEEHHRRRVETIRRSGTTLLSMLDSLFDLARADAKELQSDKNLASTAERPSASDQDQHVEHPAPEECAIVRSKIAQETKPEPVWDILVVEDNADMAMLVEDFIEEAGHRSMVARDGASALKLLDEQHFDVVLMDGHMPDMNGFEATKRIRDLPDQRAELPIVALTGEALVGDRERYLSAGMDDYVAKPVDYERLIAAINRCCRPR